MTRFLLPAAGAALLLAGCGKTDALRPAVGQALPVKPAAAREAPTAEKLLTPPVEARPDRVDEPLRRSRPRRDDPFDLPPPGVSPDGESDEDDADDTRVGEENDPGRANR